jgi:serine/threonine protein kinase
MDGDLLTRLRPLAEEYVRDRGKVLRAIAAGGSAAVYVIKEGEREFALKVYDPALLRGKNAPAELHRIELQRKITDHDCSWLIQVFAVVVQDNQCFVEMEYLPWETLKSQVGHVPDAVVPMLLAQLVGAARFLEDKGIVHRDIKPENILVAPDFSSLKLIDLGVVRAANSDEDGADATDQGERRPFVATAQYSSPEYLFRLEAPSVDMWRALTFYQIGGVLHDLLVKRPLFSEAARTENKHVISMAVFRQSPDLSTASAEHRSLALLAAHCLTKDPNLRLRLVTWERFVSPVLTGVQRLQAISAQLRAVQQADRELQQVARNDTTRRVAFVRDSEAQLKQDLIPLVAGTFTIVSFPQDAAAIQITLRHQREGQVQLALRFAWGEDPLPLKGAVTLLAAMPGEPIDTFASAAVAEVDATAAVDLNRPGFRGGRLV